MFGKKQKARLESLVETVLQKLLDGHFIAVREQILNSLKGPEEIERLTKCITVLRSDIEDLRAKKRREQRELEHLLKMQEEKILIEQGRLEMELEKKYQEKTAALLSEKHDMAMGQLLGFKKELGDVYKHILQRLPNVNMEVVRYTGVKDEANGDCADI